MLVAAAAVEAAQTDFIPREVRGHPVEDHADSRLMQPVDEIHEVMRRAEPGGWGEVPGDRHDLQAALHGRGLQDDQADRAG